MREVIDLMFDESGHGGQLFPGGPCDNAIDAVRASRVVQGLPPGPTLPACLDPGWTSEPLPQAGAQSAAPAELMHHPV